MEKTTRRIKRRVMIKRYENRLIGSSNEREMTEDANGGWVRYEDLEGKKLFCDNCLEEVSPVSLGQMCPHCYGEF